MSTNQSSPIAFFSNTTDRLASTNDVKQQSLIAGDRSISDRLTFYEIDSTAQWINDNHYCRPTLQFSDSLLIDSSFVSQQLEMRTGIKPYILADTSYGSCCIDKVAAEHVNGDCLVHYGDACMSQIVDNFPVRYVYGDYRIDFDDFYNQLQMDYVNNDDQCNSLCLLYDVCYLSSAESVLKVCQSIYGNDRLFHCSLKSSTDNTSSSLGRLIPIDFDNQPNITVIFIGESNSSLLTLWLMSHPNCTTILNYSPILCTFNRQQSTSTRALRKRLYLIERIKDARTIGVVCGTLAIDGHRLAIDRLNQLCRRSDKHLYMFSIGKLNVPKLSNFAIDIDVFVLIACPFATILDNGEYYRPIVSMFEAEMALNRDRSWFAECGWTAEFGRLLSGMSDHMCDLCFKDDLDDNCKQLEATPDLSLITGRIRSDNLITNDGATGDNTTAIQVYSSGDYFQTRSWKGLLPPESIDQQSSVIVTTAEPGRSGIAAHYDVEPTNN